MKIEEIVEKIEVLKDELDDIQAELESLDSIESLVADIKVKINKLKEHGFEPYAIYLKSDLFQKFLEKYYSSYITCNQTLLQKYHLENVPVIGITLSEREWYVCV